MPYTGQGGGMGVDESPLIDSRYVITWNDDTILPPPPTNLIITELSEKVVDETGGLYMVTE